ncbi:PBECR3 domain-containing polyvalent protein [Bacillus paranthracis]|uniref:PBECR3 domain-containing polyvalent protein n=1 Tax=Bacillus paranthracis TaxID=2026186 RepID=UPI00283F877D|nr:PBECR2 nuclease fold domain-containing protein [Bacillus paranthracis]MDR4144987.1 transposase [Bacillus paranthracis]MDR4390420.1 transposase [Bacillus paranthracis]MED1078232.1 PBECR2 nuclease fold domain-containing protein [Bacillus paranthracis]
MKREKIGEINDVVSNILKLPFKTDIPIILGESNLEHMKKQHPEDFEKYGDKISEIISSPDYVAKHPRKDSIEYIKVYIDEETEEHVLVAVRATNSGVFYARTLFVMSEEKVKRYTSKGALHKYKK